MSGLPPTARPPTPSDLVEIARGLHLELTEEEASDFADLVADGMAAFERLDSLSEPVRRSRFTDRDPGYRPGPDEDPHNAIVTRCRVDGAGEGPLDGYAVGVKDNVAVAGVELTLGSPVMRGYVPMRDAVVVDRLLAAGAAITAKTNMDEMAVSGSGEPTATGPIRNPRDPEYLAGGSSGGSAVAVVTGDVDVAIGTDQAGSIRTPASWCGCVGLKPSYGLVPYTGIAGGGPTYDHVGPITATVADAARVLTAIAGRHPSDPRQGAVATADYHEEVADGADDLVVGRLGEGFGRGEAAVDRAVDAALDGFSDAGVRVTDVSVPFHEDGPLVWVGVAKHEGPAMMRDEGVGRYLRGEYDTQFLDQFAKARRARADDFAPTVKLNLLLGTYMAEEYGGYYYAKAQNVRRALTRAYDEAFEDVDLLAMPTTPETAFRVGDDLTRKELVRRAQGKGGRTTNTMPFDMSGHPAISIPCGTVDGLPVGLMLVGRHGEDGAVLRAAHAFEEAVDWQADAST